MRSRILFLAFSILIPAAGCEEQVDVQTKADQVRAALSSAATRDEFVRIAEQSGLVCHGSDPTKAQCTWHQPRKPSMASATACGEFPGMVTADATFVDGRRQGGYEVEDHYTGC